MTGGAVVDQLAAGPIGEAASMDIVTGERVTDIPFDAVEQDAVTKHVRTPSEAVCFDILLPARFASMGEPRLALYTLINGDFPFQEDSRQRDLIPIQEQLRNCGVAACAPPPAEVHRYTEMLRWLEERIGINLEQFVLYRLVMKYPPIPSCLVVHYALPAR